MSKQYIHLLPDAVANQIAAGEVIQRPASAVKELMENAIDAGATNIQLIIKNAGKSLIQIVDNGKGMNETDARLCFERHATSKIKSAEDLFNLHSFGFRGEALASIAAIAHVELKTRPADEDLGTHIILKGSEVLQQEPCQCPVGTSIAVKHLFFNVPARRNFLKSDAVEQRHIIEEFQRIVLPNPSISFSLYHNNNAIYELKAGTLHERILQILGAPYKNRLVPVSLEEDYVRIYGYIAKPEFARKTRGDQYFFVNQRFIKSGYLNKAVLTAYDNILPSGSYPPYLLYIDIDPDRVDINVHPTKQEVKFDDERALFLMMQKTVKDALAAHSLTPSLNFDAAIDTPFTPTFNPNASINISQSDNNTKAPKNFTANKASDNKVPKNWQDLYTTPNVQALPSQQAQSLFSNNAETASFKGVDNSHVDNNQADAIDYKPYQIHNKYIVTTIPNGVILLHQQAAHERILYEKYIQQHEINNSNKQPVQQLLHPEVVSLKPAEINMLLPLLPELNKLGYQIQDFGNNSIIIQGLPAQLAQQNQDTTALITSFIHHYTQHTNTAPKAEEHNAIRQLAQAMAAAQSIKSGQVLRPAEMQVLIKQLLACKAPTHSPTGKATMLTYSLQEIDKRFNP